MREMYKEIGALVFIVLLSLSLFTVMPRNYPHVVSYKYALEAENLVKTPENTEPFYQLTISAYYLLGGGATDFDRGLFHFVVMNLPVALGLVSVVALYLAVRVRLGVVPGLFASVFLASSPLFLLNSLQGVYAPEIMSVALFSVAIALFVLGHMIKNVFAKAGLAFLAGLLLGYNMVVTEAGALLAGVVIASTAVQFLYYVKEGKPFVYGVKLVALVAPILFFVPSAKFADLSQQMSGAG
ncbi:MAG: STT3 domain-containing protein, partial [Candidatus Micrarchaeota archaeon]